MDSRTSCGCELHSTLLTVMQVAKAKAAAEARRQAERAELERLAAERRAAGLASPSPERQASPSQPDAVAVTRGSREISCCFTAYSPKVTLHAAGPARDSWACRQHTTSSPKQHLLLCLSARAEGPACLLQQRPLGGPCWQHVSGYNTALSPVSCCLCHRLWLRGSFLPRLGAEAVALVCL